MQKDFIYENYLKMPDDLEFEQAMKVYEELLEEAAAQNISVDENSMTSYGIMHFIV